MFIEDILAQFWRPVWKKYKIEVVLITVALTIAAISAVILIIPIKEPPISKAPRVYNNSEKPVSKNIFVDISGSVKNPGLYQFEVANRIKDAIDRAGGLSDDADKIFFNRNFNLARILSDQEKIYVPSSYEINSGVFESNNRLPVYLEPTTDRQDSAELIDINTATSEELDTLTGVGQTTAQKITNGRPYASTQELLTRKIVNRGVFNKIKDEITVN